MLFNSPIFIFTFLPVVLGGYYALGLWHRKAAACWLALSSFVFYGWWDPTFVILLAGSMLFNFGISVLLRSNERRPKRQNLILVFGITADLLVLFYYKYFAFIVGLIGATGLISMPPPTIILPLGLSFFTFTQIGFLVDSRQGLAAERGFIEYMLFVTFFPHLIAGPILHHREMMPQFAKPETYCWRWESMSVGMTIFFLGLLKKVVLADSLIEPVSQGFGHPEQLGALASWLTAVGYSLQLYFDFSAYSDMAIGLAFMFNIRFPLNFNSPYKSRSIIEFWQRWHMTLTRYLTLYLYNPMALRIARRHASTRPAPAAGKQRKTLGNFLSSIGTPTIITMALAGIWHGAGLQFLIFGLLHGVYLMVNHAWRVFRPARPRSERTGLRRILITVSQILLTYIAVVIAEIFFRATSVTNAMDVISGMVGLHLSAAGEPWTGRSLAALALCGAIAFAAPNIHQIMANYPAALGQLKMPRYLPLQWQPSYRWAVCLGFVAAFGIANLWNVSEFLYFQF